MKRRRSLTRNQSKADNTFTSVSVSASASFPVLISERYDISHRGDGIHTATEVLSQFSSARPWKHALLPDFLLDEACARIREELLQESWFQKDNDLYRFVQTEDLKCSSQPSLVALRSTLFGADFRRFLELATGCPEGTLLPLVDIAGQIYGRGDHLLCHDDSLEGRRFAFIYYLVPANPPWSAKRDGGALQLLPVDPWTQTVVDDADSLDARTRGAMIVPRWNTFAFFEVNSVSHHQVREIFGNRPRLSITGWFHGYSLPPPPPSSPIEVPVKMLPLELVGRFSPTMDDCRKLLSVLEPSFVNPKTILNLQNQINEEGAISLVHFLRDDIYQAVLDELASCRARNWQIRGPPNKRRYSLLDDLSDEVMEAVTPTLRALRAVFVSTPFSRWLSNITGVELKSAAECRWRRWRRGDYTLAQDCEDLDASTTAKPGAVNVDIVLSVQHADDDLAWQNTNVGGYLVYLARGKDVELFTASSTSNTLTIVKRREDTLRFFKYITHDAPAKGKYDLATSYYED